MHNWFDILCGALAMVVIVIGVPYILYGFGG